MAIKNVGVIGAGTMGSSIAYLMAFNGKNVTLVDVSNDLLERGKSSIRKIIDSQISFHEARASREIRKIESLGITLTEQQKTAIEEKLDVGFDRNMFEKILDNIETTTYYDKLSDMELVIEAAFENIDVKISILERLNNILNNHTVVASNSSSISVTQMASHYRYPEKFILTHFFNPPFTLPLVEIVRGLKTSDETFAAVMAFFKDLHNHRGDMKPIPVKETPGFLVNRILVPMINEAFMMLDENVASPEDIDTAMKAGAGMPMGPLELADMVGIDITYDVIKILYDEFGDPKYRPSVLLKRYKASGRLGRKTGSGVFDY
jgi:3-hydroxyacyl-CoA dehydrogenase